MVSRQVNIEVRSLKLILKFYMCLTLAILNHSSVASTVSVRTLTEKLMKRPSGSASFFINF